MGDKNLNEQFCAFDLFIGKNSMLILLSLYLLLSTTSLYTEKEGGDKEFWPIRIPRFKVILKD